MAKISLFKLMVYLSVAISSSLLWAQQEGELSKRDQERMAEGGIQVPCSVNPVTNQTYYCSPSQLEAGLRAMQQRALIEHQNYLAYQACMKNINMGPGSLQAEQGFCTAQSGWPAW
jgi:hypothetical protein